MSMILSTHIPPHCPSCLLEMKCYRQENTNFLLVYLSHASVCAPDDNEPLECSGFIHYGFISWGQPLITDV